MRRLHTLKLQLASLVFICSVLVFALNALQHSSWLRFSLYAWLHPARPAATPEAPAVRPVSGPPASGLLRPPGKAPELAALPPLPLA